MLAILSAVALVEGDAKPYEPFWLENGYQIIDHGYGHYSYHKREADAHGYGYGHGYHGHHHGYRPHHRNHVYGKGFVFEYDEKVAESVYNFKILKDMDIMDTMDMVMGTGTTDTFMENKYLKTF